MTVRIQFDIDNDAFTGGPYQYDTDEVARTVEKVAQAIRDNAAVNGPHVLAKCESILDCNGNRIGQWCIKDAELL